ncbi:MAG: alpha/beta hydrolase [Labilithrix sp.]|nr:alpha/beta hydrolase [Labilithrix sp.]MCW5809921.1 alpha/beta hydrolase [Labilithrix sp.]
MANAALKVLVKIGAWFAALPYLCVVLLMLTGSPTWSGVAYLAGLGLLLGGLMTLPTGERQERRVFGRTWPRGISRGAVVALFAIALVRGCTAGEGATLHFSPDARFVDRVVDERDLALPGARVLFASGVLVDDAAEVPTAMREAYSKMHAQEGDVPSPVVATYLGMQSPDAFDTVVIEPRASPRPTSAVIFLHGYAGNFSLPCWQVAEAVSPLGVLTACPSTRWIGDWGSKNGEATVRRTIEALRARGVTTIVLAGLSNGGYGASHLAPRLRGQLAGLVLVSGADPAASDAGVPALLIHGRHDEMVGFWEASAYAARHPRAKLVALDAGHFALLVRSEIANRALHDFVAKLVPPQA